MDKGPLDTILVWDSYPGRGCPRLASVPAHRSIMSVAWAVMAVATTTTPAPG